MTLAAVVVYWLIVAIWLSVLGTLVFFYARNPRIFGTTRLLLAVIAIDTLRNVVENVYFGAYFGAQYGVFPAEVAATLGQPGLLLMPKLLNIAAGRERASPPEVVWAVGDAQALPLPDACADAYVIGFGIRNVTDVEAALREARRVLRPGGRFLCLEFSRPVTEALQKAYDAYSFKVIPEIGARVAGDRASYQYLVESIRRFPDQRRFAAMIGEAGFGRVEFTNFTGGVAALHSGRAI